MDHTLHIIISFIAILLLGAFYCYVLRKKKPSKTCSNSAPASNGANGGEDGTAEEGIKDCSYCTIDELVDALNLQVVSRSGDAGTLVAFQGGHYVLRMLNDGKTLTVTFHKFYECPSQYTSGIILLAHDINRSALYWRCVHDMETKDDGEEVIVLSFHCALNNMPDRKVYLS